MKALKFLFIAFALVLIMPMVTSCSEEEGNGPGYDGILGVYPHGGNSNSGASTGGNSYNQNSLNGMTLIMKINGNTYISATHYKDGATINNITVDYKTLPPYYTYSKTGNVAKYHLEVVKKTYISYSKDYVYNKFVFDYTLNFTTNNSGTFKGTETNAYGTKTEKEGTFTLSK